MANSDWNLSKAFENMSAQEIADDIYNNTKNAPDVDNAFERLKSVDAPLRKTAVTALENNLVRDLGGLVEDFKMLWFGGDDDVMTSGAWDIGSASANPRGLDEEDTRDLAETQSCFQMLQHISQIKGEEAHPVTKAIVKKRLELSDTEYNNNTKLEVTAVKAYIEATATPALSRPNPAKKPHRPSI